MSKRKPVVLNRNDVKDRPVEIVRPRGICIDLPPYKDSTGKWRTTSLFHETFDWTAKDADGVFLSEKYTPIFTLREFPLVLGDASPFKDRYTDGVIPSIRELYLSYNDPTEHKFALEVLKSTFHWKHLCTLEWFKPYVEEWRITLNQKLRQIGIEEMVRIAQGLDPKFALAASKWLAEGGFESHRGKGRPSHKEVEQRVVSEAKVERIYQEDAERLGIDTTPKTVLPPEGSIQ